MVDDEKLLGVAHEGAYENFRDDMSYGDYLKLDQLLSAQHPLSKEPNELLFIVQHQATELWMKLALTELMRARSCIQLEDLSPAFKMMARVSRIMNNLIQSWDILSTLTPTEYSAFRESLARSSGFQSHQNRMLEFLFGNKSRMMLKPFAHQTEIYTKLTELLNSPSLYDEANRLLAKRGFVLDKVAIDRDWSAPYVANASVAAAWAEVYGDTKQYWDLYELAEKLVDLEDYFRQWRFRHVTTVERVIGFKRGSGGTSGVDYLRKMVDVRLFPELWDIRTSL
ncbi:MAG: tryptophan 2,3-dioxygenase [Rhodocyclaceae bacterium]|jgi:tryptophan 2,3-dioxygenase|nr:tryptophan 2,3-dioxygenase [Rhodocyclaceae bacterium]MCA3017384.1 tryptophan 2,3-dioxygenase [Rhodocyclaceae bacterium]MCA3021604.1 tryptophan 2,3-dioxygenase [Rhodocyclaceae bacterium]MCA3024204.1 tryptophan 2,3-dioxygenase [Rhodocyclaceae bacterium]MCA3029753.1 tryptophan 2,3-dioxygenase [Rhodocyclaceae bacterium]